MRHGNVWAAGLALGLGLGAAGAALGQEPPGEAGWLSRLFGRGAPPAAAHRNDKDEPKEERLVAPPSPAAQRARAEADFLRRLEVCLKLQEIAFEAGDDDLKHRAEQLEQRAKDAYERRTNRAGTASGEADSQQSHLAPGDGAPAAPPSTRRKTGGPTSGEDR